MRAKEFTNFNFEIEPYEGWTGEGVVVRAYDGKDEVGHVIFEPTEDDETQWYAVDVEVEEPYQRRGIATKMYDMAKKAATSAGAIIVKSHTQTDAGRGLWQDKNVWEQVNESREDVEGLTIEMTKHGHQLVVNALDDWGNKLLGFVIFNIGDGKELDPQELEVVDQYRGQGIAKVMYDYVKSKGYKIVRSWDQTDAGKGFWDKHRGEEVRVWESEEQTYSAKQVLQYIKSIHKDVWQPSADGMVTRHNQWKLTQVPVTILRIPDPESDEDYKDPYFRVHDTDLQLVDRLVPTIQTFIQKTPVVIDREGHLIDGNHRALAALKAGLKTIPAYVPVQEQVSEAFDDPYRIKWEKSDFGDWDALATLSDGTYLNIMFNNEGDEEWQVEFHRNHSQEVTGEGDAQRVFATVLTAIQQFIKKEHPWRIIFSAKQEVEPGQYNPSRSKLYNSLVRRYANLWGYDEYYEDQGDQVVYELTRKK